MVMERRNDVGYPLWQSWAFVVALLFLSTSMLLIIIS